MKKTGILYLVLTVAMGFWLWSIFGDGEEAQIRSRLQEIEELVEKSAGEGALDGVGRARSFADLFTDPFSAEVAPAGSRIGDKAQLMQAFVGFRHASETVSLDYRNVEIAVGGNQKEAVAAFEALLNGGPGGILADEGYAVELRFRKVKGDWLVSQAKVDHAVGR